MKILNIQGKWWLFSDDGVKRLHDQGFDTRAEAEARKTLLEKLNALKHLNKTRVKRRR
jgi:hypothetical protein